MTSRESGGIVESCEALALLLAKSRTRGDVFMDLLIRLRPKWWDKAACRGVSACVSTVFFQEEGRSSRLTEAKALCATCPVWDDCYREHVVEGAEQFGVWAGFNRDEGVKERKRLGIKLQSAYGRPVNDVV